MKTKLIILTALTAALLYSCSDSDRDNDLNKEAVEKIKPNQKIKLNKEGLTNKTEEHVIQSDSTRIDVPNSELLQPNSPVYPEDENEIVDPTKPDKPW